ncbi:MAG: hypothetical protein H3C35_09000 [Bacteroidetes bacterium]|nr:hypothetical protein [Bacteroidota bacterium]
MSSTLPFTAIDESEQYSPIFVRFFVSSILLLLVLTHTPLHFISRWYNETAEYLAACHIFSFDVRELFAVQKDFFIQTILTPVRTFLFFISFIVAAIPIGASLRIFILQNSKYFLPALKKTYPALIVLSLLIIPVKLGLMAGGYAQMSYHPLGFFDETNQLYQRLLMPALAYLLQMQGMFLYYIFSLCITALLIWLVNIYFMQKGTVLNLIECISLCTSSFIMTQLQSPGYTEQLSYLFLLMVFIVPLSSFAKYSIVVFSLITHEISGLSFAVLALVMFSKKEKISIFMILLLYASCWLMSFGFNIANLLAARNVGNESGWWWAVQFPYREVLGIGIAYKLLWVVIGAAFFQMNNERKIIGGLVAAALLFTLGGVDTSRLMGYAFPALLISFYYVKKYSLLKDLYVQRLVWLNLLVPSFYVGTNIGIVFFPGLYQLFYKGIFF